MLMRWKVRFYFTVSSGTTIGPGQTIGPKTVLGTFREQTITPGLDGPKGLFLDVYLDDGDKPGDTIRAAMPEVLRLLQDIEFVSGLGAIVVFNVHQIFTSPTETTSLTNDEIKNLNLNAGTFLQKLFVFPPQPPVQNIRQGNINLEISDVHEIHDRDVTPEWLQEIITNLV